MKTDAERFAEKWKLNPDTGCWVWQGYLSRGYGRFRIGHKKLAAHRFAYELMGNPIPAGMTLDHLCRNTACVNPNHLEPVTNKENIQRQRATITHCPAGHPYSGYNLSFSVSPETTRRYCKTCKRIKNRIYRGR